MAPIPDGNQDGPNRNENDIGDIESPEFNINVESDSNSSDDGEDGPTGLGYQLLPQEPDTEGDENNVTVENGSAYHHGIITDASPQETTTLAVDHTIKTTLDNHDLQHGTAQSQQLPTVLNAEAAERRNVWNQPDQHRNPVTPMNKDDVQKIKAVMANIVLPTPDWAKEIPEEEWKHQLFTKLTYSSNTTFCAKHKTDNSKHSGTVSGITVKSPQLERSENKCTEYQHSGKETVKESDDNTKEAIS